MKKSHLEILSINDIKKEELEDKLKDYKRMYGWESPYIKLQKTKYKFGNKMNKIITNKGKEINANLAVIRPLDIDYPNNIANYYVIFYKKI